MTEERVQRLLSELGSDPVDVPDADTTYHRARVRLALEQERARRARASRPLALFQRAVAGLSIATALAALPFAPALGLFAAPLIVGAASLGTLLLCEASP